MGFITLAARHVIELGTQSVPVDTSECCFCSWSGSVPQQLHTGPRPVICMPSRRSFVVCNNVLPSVLDSLFPAGSDGESMLQQRIKKETKQGGFSGPTCSTPPADGPGFAQCRTPTWLSCS